MTDNNPPSGGDAFWDRWHGPDDEAGATAGDAVAPNAPGEPTQQLPQAPPSQPMGGYASPDAYQAGYPQPAPPAPGYATQPGAWQSAQPQPYPGQPYPGQPYPGQPYSGQPYPGQPYPGQPYPPGQQYAGQQYPPGPPWAGQQPGYPAGSYAPPPPPRPRRTGLFILLGVLGLCVVLVVGALLMRPGTSTTGTTGTGGATSASSPGGGATTTTTVTATASDAVKGYLEALAAGDAATALGYAASPPRDTALLNDDVLAAGNAEAPISDITVEPSTASGSTDVQAHYSIGQDAVDATFVAVETPTGWRLQDVAGQVSVDQFPSVAALNGVPVPSGESLTLFPGSYRISTADDRYQLTGGSFVMESPTDSVSVKVTTKLSSSGLAAVRSAAQKRLNACIKENKMHPSDGCGMWIRAEDQKGKKFTPRKVRWHITSGASTLKSLKLTVSPNDATVVTGKSKVRLYLRVDATNGRWYWATVTIASVRAILGDNSIEVRFNE